MNDHHERVRATALLKDILVEWGLTEGKAKNAALRCFWGVDVNAEAFGERPKHGAIAVHTGQEVSPEENLCPFLRKPQVP